MSFVTGFSVFRSQAGRVILAGFSILLLVGCQSRSTSYVESGPLNYTERHPIVLAEEADKLDIFIGSGKRDITRGDAAAVKAFTRSYRQDGTGLMKILVPSGSANETGAMASLKSIRRAIAVGGGNPASMRVAHYRFDDPNANAPVRLTFNRIQAVTNLCGQWPDNIIATRKNKDYYNFGCASQQNFAAMVADPRDLVRQRGSSPRDTRRQNDVLTKYSKGQSTPTKYDKSNDIKISSAVN